LPTVPDLVSQSNGSALRRTLTSLALATMLAAALLIFAPVQQARATVDGDWVCSVPAGFTYDEVRSTFGCTTIGTAPQYHARVPANGLWACGVPAGFTWDAVQWTSRCTPIFGSSARQFRLRRL
jgi:hypothetical protein